MSTAYTYDVTLPIPGDKGGVVAVDRASKYGYWEYRDGSEGGGLWFELHPSGSLELMDYDGAYVMPRYVTEMLRSAGFIVDDIYLP